jgi:acetyl-CoA acetyltransferase
LTKLPLREARAEIGTDIDGIASAGETPVTVAHYLGLIPKWVDGTAVGGCSFMMHVRHAAAAIAAGLCETVLITHGESGRSGVGRTRNEYTGVFMTVPSSRRLVRHDDRARGGEHAAHTVADRDLGAGDLGGG